MTILLAFFMLGSDVISSFLLVCCCLPGVLTVLGWLFLPESGREPLLTIRSVRELFAYYQSIADIRIRSRNEDIIKPALAGSHHLAIVGKLAHSSVRPNMNRMPDCPLPLPLPQRKHHSETN